jgi:hypothetical protein
MKYLYLACLICIISGFSSCHPKYEAGNLVNDTIILSDTIQFHPVRISKTDGSILPWFSADRGSSYGAGGLFKKEESLRFKKTQETLLIFCAKG